MLEFKLGYKGRSILDRTFKLSGFNTIRFVVFLLYSRERDSDLNSKNYGNIDVADCNLLMKQMSHDVTLLVDAAQGLGEPRVSFVF